MPRWFRLAAALVIYAVIMAVITRTIDSWALPAQERGIESIFDRLLTLGAFGVISAFVVYRLFVRPGRNIEDLR